MPNGMTKKILVIVVAGIILAAIAFWTQGSFLANVNAERLQNIDTKFDRIIELLEK